MSVKNQNGKVTIEDLPPLFAKLKALSATFKEDEIKGMLGELGSDTSTDVSFEEFLKVYGGSTFHWGIEDWTEYECDMYIM